MATEFLPLRVALLTLSDTRTLSEDRSGAYLESALLEAGHALAARSLCPDDRYAMRALVSAWIADSEIDVVLTTGGTGFTGRDSTPEALVPLFDKQIEGFGELFRMKSFDEIGTSTIQSRAVAGLANGTMIFCLPGSQGACRTAWEGILKAQLDARHKPCNFAELIPRFLER